MTVMKKIHITLICLASLLSFFACDKDETKMYVLSAEYATVPSLTMQGPSFVEVTLENYDIFPTVLNWSRAGFGKDVVVEYILQLDTDEAFGGDGLTISLGNNLFSKALSGKDLSDWAIKNFGAFDDKTKEMSERTFNMRIAATPALDNTTVTNYPDTVFSNVIALGVQAYYQAPAYPETMYMIGEEFGGWDWSSEGIAVMTPVWGFEGHFWTVRYISSGKGFKWCAKREWSGDFFKLDEEIGYTDKDGNAFVATSGMYMVYMDMVKGKIAVEPAQVYGMGDCFGGWNTGAYPFTVDGKVMKITTTGSGELRMYAKSTIAPNGDDWWKMEFIFLNGKIEYRGNGDDQSRVKVDAGKTVTLDFNAGTGIVQ